MDSEKKRILVLSGGGSKGAYEVGALKYLINEQNREYDGICGISVGALNGSFLAQYPKNKIKQGIADLEEFWLKISEKDIYKKWFGWPITVPWKPSVFNSKPLQKLIDRNLDLELLRNSGVPLYVGTVGLKTGNIVYKNQSVEGIKDWIAASSAFPLMLSPVKIGSLYWTDGGVRDVTPVNVAIRNLDATDIDIIVAQERFRADRGKKPNVIRDINFILEILMNEVIENDLDMAYMYNDILKQLPDYEGKRLIDFTTIRPIGKLNHSSLKFDHDLIKKDIELGYMDAEKEFL